MKDKYITYVLIAAIIFGIFYFSSCPDKPVKNNALEEAKKQFVAKEKILLDSLSVVNERLNAREKNIVVLKNQVDSFMMMKKSVPYEATKKNYQSAKQKRDTVQMLAVCDTIQDQFDEYRRLDRIEHDKTRTAFKEYDEQIADFKTQVKNGTDLYKNEKDKNAVLEIENKQLNNDLKKQIKKQRRERIIGGVIVVVAIILSI
jgi:septal ring factor EnvC (AmiA/AmiB activator)